MWNRRGGVSVHASVDLVIGVGLVAALLLTLLLPALGAGGDYGRLQDTIAVGLVGFMGKAAVTREK